MSFKIILYGIYPKNATDMPNLSSDSDKKTKQFESKMIEQIDEAVSLYFDTFKFLNWQDNFKRYFPEAYKSFDGFNNTQIQFQLDLIEFVDENKPTLISSRIINFNPDDENNKGLHYLHNEKQQRFSTFPEAYKQLKEFQLNENESIVITTVGKKDLFLMCRKYNESYENWLKRYLANQSI